jgi:hypothetical protein
MAGADLCADRGAERGGHFTWSEWAEEFGPRVQGVGAEHYWEIWSEALVALLERRASPPRRRFWP